MDEMSDLFLPPSRFVSLHGHSTCSSFDGLGWPAEHMDFCLKNGLDGWGLTDHGNGNGLAHAHAHAKKIKQKGGKFRQLYGVEFYFVPDLEDWKVRYDLAKIEKEKEKISSKKSIKNAAEEEEDAGLVVEDEDDTRSEKKERFVDINKRYHLVVVAKNNKGLENLFTLVKKSYVDGFYKFPRIDFKLLKLHGEGLVVSSACVGGIPSGIIYSEFPDTKFMDLNPTLVDDDTVRNRIRNKIENTVDRFVDCVGQENFFLELQFNKLTAQDLTNRMLIETARSTGCKLIATADSHYPEPGLWEAREIYRQLLPGRIKAGTDPQPLPKKEELKAELYPKNAGQMWDEYLTRHSEYSWYAGTEVAVKTAIENGYDVAWNLCEEITFSSVAKLPSYNTTETTETKLLVDLVKKGLIAAGLDKNQTYIDRAKEELADIKFLKFESYFLTLQKILEVAEQRTLLGSGRGSGSGSLVNFLLGITHVDPVKYGLLWTRFLNKTKAGWPDIDTDVGDRDKLIEAAREIFGNDAVIPVSNVNGMKLKSLVKDVSKFYGVPFDEVNAVTGPLDREVEMKSRDPNMEKSMFVLKHDDCMEHSTNYRNFMEKYPNVEEKIKNLFGSVRSLGRHAGGVLVCPNLEKHMPLITVRGELQTPWTEGVNIRNLEENGFLKFDFLGLNQMQMVQDCISRILTRENGTTPSFANIKKFYDDKLNCRYVEPTDTKVFQYVFCGQRYPNIFQLSGHGARKFCHEAQPTNVEEFAAITAIYRPGPLKANVHKKYVEAKRNPQNIKYDHPIIEEVLGSTFGFIVMQEQFMVLAQRLAGFSMGDADKMRKTLVKKDITSLGKKSEEKEALEQKFVDGCVELSGMDRQTSKKLFDTIAYFSLYGFCKCLHGDVEVLTTAGKKKIKDVVVGDHVFSPNGYVKVKETFKQGIKKIVEIKTSSGKSIKCTMDHKFMTDKGMMPLHEIIKQNKKLIVTNKNNDEIISITDCGEAETFDIEVDHEDHAFYANDFIVSNSHAISYSIDSYYGAWLFTHYETDWLATCLQTENANVESLASMMAEIKQLGYEIASPDINHSTHQWSWSQKLESFVPPLSSLKGVGESAVNEIMENRPYTSLDDLLFDNEGKWRHSKFNKKALSALIAMEALSSFNEFGDGRLQNHKQIWNIVMDNFDILKKGKYGTVSKKNIKKELSVTTTTQSSLDKLINDVQGMEDWNRYEKLTLQTETSGTAPFHIVFPIEVLEKIKSHDIPSANEIESKTKGIGWFCVTSVEKKSTKNGKSFLRVKTLDTTLATTNLRVWGDVNMKPYSIWIGLIDNSPDWGLSTNANKLREIM